VAEHFPRKLNNTPLTNSVLAGENKPVVENARRSVHHAEHLRLRIVIIPARYIWERARFDAFYMADALPLRFFDRLSGGSICRARACGSLE
jgi:hypothetical protein